MKFTIFHFKNSGLAIFLFLFLFLHAGAQPLYFNWAKQVTGISISKNTLCDAVGNVYLIGRFNGTVDMDPSAAIYNLTSNGGSDVFIVKYSPGGNFLWAVQFGSLGIDDGYDLEVDGAGNIIATGYYQFTVDFDPGVSVNNRTATGSQDVFVIKLNSSGNLIWANSIGGTMTDYGTSLSLDAWTGSNRHTRDANMPVPWILIREQGSFRMMPQVEVMFMSLKRMHPEISFGQKVWVAL